MPNDSFLRFDDDSERKRLLPVLVEMYKYESADKVSGSSGGVKKFTDCLWTEEEIVAGITSKLPLLQTHEIENRVRELIELMTNPESRHMLRIPGNAANEMSDRYITRVAELNRTVLCLHEYTNRETSTEQGLENKKFPIVDGLRWEPRLRYGSERKHSSNDLIDAVRNAFSVAHRLPVSFGNILLHEALEDLKLVLKAASHVIAGNEENLKFTEFQLNSIVQSFKNSWSLGTNSALVITAGTGMGKTLGFTIPVITDALLANRTAADGQKVCSQLLMYPRNDLAKDQFENITKIIKRLNYNFISSGENNRCLGTILDADGRIRQSQPRFPTSAGEAPNWRVGGTNVYEASLEAYAGTNNGGKPASIIACSIESFRRRLRIPSVCKHLGKNLKRIVFDEVHLSSGIQGGHHSRLLSRCRQLVASQRGTNRDLTFVGVSATIAKPRLHLSKLWFTSDSRAMDVDHINSEELQKDAPMGIRHNVLVRPRKGPSPIGTLVDMTSAVAHQRRSREFYNRPQNAGGAYKYQELQKTIGFADSHEIVGNWYSFMLDNESTSWANRLGNSTRRPYSHWHSRPLEIHDGGDEVCDSCQTMQYHHAPIPIPEGDLPKFRHMPGDTLDSAHAWELPLYPSGTGDLEVRGLDTCHHLQSGTCWWFAPRTMEAEQRPGALDTSYRDVVRVKRHTGKTKDQGEDLAEGEAKADYAFRTIPKKGAYPRNYDENLYPPIPHDVAIATPTLEVGVDMSNVSEVLTHKAIRNISSYRQKVGRAGREPGTDALAMTLMSSRRQEFQFYRSMIRLIDSEILEPVPVASNNLAMMAHQAYEGVFDYLSASGHEIEYIPNLVQQHPGDQRFNEWNALSENIILALNEICTIDPTTNETTAINNNCDEYLRKAVQIYDSSIRKKAIRTVAKHLKYFLVEMPIGNVTVIQYLATKNANMPLNAAQQNVQTWGYIRNLLEPTITDGEAHLELNEEDREDFTSHLNNLMAAMNNADVTAFKESLNNLRNFMEGLGYDLGPRSSPLIPALIAFTSMLIPAPVVPTIAKQVKGLLPKVQTRTLSLTMYNCQIFLQDAPYCPLNTLFSNPHEAPVKVRRGLDIEHITAKEAIRYTAPGMWTHRLFGGQRMFVTHRGDVELLNPDIGNHFKMHLDEGEYAPILSFTNQAIQANEYDRIPKILDINPTLETRKWKLKQLRVKSDYGVQGEPNSVFQGVEPFMGLMWSNHQPRDISQGNAGKIKRPRAHSVTWQMSDLSQNSRSISTYEIMYTKPADEGEPVSVPVVSHPLMNVLFSDVKFDPQMKINRMAFGVTRSNMMVLHNYVEEQSAAIIDEFETNGIRFEINNDLLERALNIGSDLNHPFDERVLKMLGEWILSEKEKFSANSFKIKAILDILADEAYRQSNQEVPENKFPRTIKEFFELLFDSSNDWSDQVIPNRVQEDAIANQDADEDIAEFSEFKNKLFDEKEYLMENYSLMMGDWYQRTYLNTLGLAASEAVSEFSGVADSKISYSFDITTNEGETQAHIDVYDEDALGNGSCELAEKFFHIPIEIRELANHFGDRNLPSNSFVEILEDRLRMCEEHMMHSIALSGVFPRGIPRWMKLEAEQLRSRYYDSRWSQLGITSIAEASLHKRRRFAFVEHGDNYRQEMLSWELALDLCNVGCAACDGDEFGNLFPPHLLAYTTCRSVVDTVLGDWAEIPGYLRKNEHSIELRTEAGNNVGEPPKYVYIKGRDPLSLGIFQRFIKYPCPPIGLSWTRNMEVPDSVDKYVRHQEVV
jgi:hypothetical protein